ncbi:MAG TPA: rhodanese-like domain-containing protein [Longimicrobiales bacterium]|nr:rhodanese-like domain-containing protein [Longimicrobiales bacterium]
MSWLSRILSRLLPAPPTIGPDEDVLFVDVRTRPEFAAGHARGALHIPLGQVDDRAAELRPHAHRRILVYCLSGHRAARAVRALRARGLPNVENAGGIGGLRRAGVEIERGR